MDIIWEWGGDRLAERELKQKRDNERFQAANEKKAIDDKEKEEHDRALARKVIFQSDVNNLYLHFGGKNPDIPNLRFAGDYSFGLDTRHEVVRQAGDTGLIHILCLRNNKYWSNLERDGNKWITAVADKPMEKESDKQCTLFRPVYGFSNKKRVVRLQHVNTGHYVRLFQGSGHYDGCLYLYPKLEDVETFTFIDWEKVVVLPDLFRIMGNNGKHLEAGRDGYMGFHRQGDDYPPVFDFEASPSRDGGVRLKSIYYDKYWTDMDDGYWVLLKEASTTAHETNTVFLPRILDGNQIQIRSLKSGKFCKRLTTRDKENCLAIQRSYEDAESKMEIDEPVISRKMNDFKYDFDDARLSNDKVSALVSQLASNESPDPYTKVLKLTASVTDTTNWNISREVKVGFEVTGSAKIPVVGETGFSLSTEYTFTKDHGGEREEKHEISDETEVTVPPMTKKKATLMEKRRSYQIPYSYTQYDLLRNGSTNVSEKHGICTVDYGYSYETVVSRVP